MKLSKEDYEKIPYEQLNGIYEVEDVGTYYYVNGKCHRENGPAIEYADGTKHWYVNNKQHRLDGPAYENLDVPKYVEYWIEDKRYYTKEEFDKVAYMYINGLMNYL